MRPPRCHVYGTIEISIANKPSAAKTSLSKLGKCWIFFAVIFTYFYLHLLNSVDSNALTARRAWAWILLGCFCVEVACSARILWCPPTVQLGDSKVSVDVNGSGSILPRIHQNLGIWWVNFQRPRNQFIAAVATFPFMVWNVGCAAWKHQKKKKVFHSFFFLGRFCPRCIYGATWMTVQSDRTCHSLRKYYSFLLWQNKTQNSATMFSIFYTPCIPCVSTLIAMLYSKYAKAAFQIILDVLLRQQVTFGDFLAWHLLLFGTVAIETLTLSCRGAPFGIQSATLTLLYLLEAHKKKHLSYFSCIYGTSYVCLYHSAILHATANEANAGVWIRRQAWGCRAHWSCEGTWTVTS